MQVQGVGFRLSESAYLCAQASALVVRVPTNLLGIGFKVWV